MKRARLWSVLKEFLKNTGLSEKLRRCLSRSMIQLEVIDRAGITLRA